MSAPNRRAIYQASLESHVDHLHRLLYAQGLFPVQLEKLEPFKGLNCKIAKVCALFHAATEFAVLAPVLMRYALEEYGRRAPTRRHSHKNKAAGTRARGKHFTYLVAGTLYSTSTF
jgi:hypothetical protein